MTIRIEDLRSEAATKGKVQYKAGQTVRVHRKIREGDKERIQVFEGLIIEVKNQKSASATITVRKIVGGIGVEQVFPVHSPLIEKIELVKEAKVRRSKLYFMRALRGKAARLRERFFTEEELKAMHKHEVTEEEVSEAVEHEKEVEKAAEKEELADEKAVEAEGEKNSEKDGNEGKEVEKKEE